MNYTLEFAPEDMQTVGRALSALPYGQVAQLMAKIQAQVTAQEASAAQGTSPIQELPPTGSAQSEQSEP